MSSKSQFDEIIKFLPPYQKGSHIDVADSMYVGLKWFQDQGITPTAGDLVKYAELVLIQDEKRLA